MAIFTRRPYDYFELILLFIAMVIGIRSIYMAISYHTIEQFYYKILFTLFITTYFCSIFGRLTCLFVRDNNSLYWTLIYFYYLMYSSSLLIFALVIYGRLKFTFIGTCHEIEKKTLNFVLFNIMTGMIFAILAIIIIIFISLKIAIIFGTIGIIIYVFNSIFMIKLFIKKLNELIKKTIGSNDELYSLISLSTKYIVISTTTYIATFILITLSFLCFLFDQLYNFGSMILIIEWIVGFNCFILQFKFSENDYYKICSKCHDKCFTIVLKNNKKENDNNENIPNELIEVASYSINNKENDKRKEIDNTVDIDIYTESSTATS